MKEPTPEQLQSMSDARCASLIKRWLAGKKLSPEDAAFVATHGHVPPEVLSAGPSSPGAKEAVQRSCQSGSDQSTRKHVKYKKKLPEYCDTYQVEKTGRVIKRWVRRGKELGDLPPLDEPEKMAAWWRRCMDHQVPDNLLGFIGGSAETIVHAAISKAAGTPPDPRAKSGDAGAPPAPRDFSQVKGLDIAENVEALRHTHAINKHLLDEALHDPEPNDTLINLRRKNFEGSFELVRKAEITLIEIQKQRGDLINKESVRAELAQVFETLRLTRETMPRRIVIALETIWPAESANRPSGSDLEFFLTPAIEKARADEENIFRNLETIRGPDDVLRILAA